MGQDQGGRPIDVGFGAGADERGSGERRFRVTVARLALEPAPRTAPLVPFDGVLVLRFGRVGDLLALTPALRALREARPASRIDLLTTATGRETLATNRRLNEIHTLSWRRVPAALNAERFLLLRRLRARHYDAAILLETARHHRALAAAVGAPRTFGLASARATVGADQASPRAGHAAEVFDAVLALAGVPHAGWHYELPVSAAARDAATALLRSGGVPRDASFIAVHAGHYVKRKRLEPHPKSWPPERWVEAIRRLEASHGLRVVLTGSRAEASLNDALTRLLSAGGTVDLSGATSLTELAAVLERAALVIASDTGPAHIAAAVGTPLVALFGPSPPHAMGPLGDESRIRRLYPEPASTAAARRGGYHARMWAIGVDDVVAAADELLRASGGARALAGVERP